MAEITGMSGPVTKIDVLGGVPGAAGVSVTTVALDADGHLLISKSNGTTTDVGKVKFDVTPEVQAAWDGAVAAEIEATTQAGIATTAASDAKDSETKADASAAAASGAAASEAAAKTSETNAASSATNAAGSATTATTKAGAASSAATAASTNASNAALSESAAATSETNAATAASNAATSASSAATSESQAAASAGVAQEAAESASTARDQAQEARSGAESAAASADAARDQAATSATTLNTWFLRGSGLPLGVVTPSAAGVQYVDTAQTCGARVWISTGTTSSAWTVVDGDTGWRNISSLLTGCTSGTLLVRRYGALVDVSIRSILPSSASSFTFMTLPTGFTRNDGTYTYIPTRPSSSLTMQNILLRGLNELVLSLNSYSLSHGDFSYALRYRSTTAWPTTLPGTPA